MGRENKRKSSQINNLIQQVNESQDLKKRRSSDEIVIKRRYARTPSAGCQFKKKDTPADCISKRTSITG